MIFFKNNWPKLQTKVWRILKKMLNESFRVILQLNYRGPFPELVPFEPQPRVPARSLELKNFVLT